MESVLAAVLAPFHLVEVDADHTESLRVLDVEQQLGMKEKK